MYLCRCLIKFEQCAATLNSHYFPQVMGVCFPQVGEKAGDDLLYDMLNEKSHIF